MFDIIDNNYYTRKNSNTSNTANNITLHNHSNYEQHVIKNVHKHIKHFNNYGTEINYYNKKSLNKKQYYNFCHDTFNSRNVENISLSQQTDITKNITETITQIINYVDVHHLNNNRITFLFQILHHLLLKTLWIPEGISDNIEPGLDSILTYIQSNNATLTTLQNSITNINNTINNETQNL